MNYKSLALIILAACAADPTTPDDPTIDDGGKADAPGSIFHAIQLIDMSLSTETPLDSEQAAAAEAVNFLAGVKESDLGICALQLHVPRDHVFGRFDNCRTFAQPVTFPDGTKFAPAFECDAGYCATQALDAAEIVHVDGSANVTTDSGRVLAHGTSTVLVFDMGKLSALVSSEDFTHGVQSDHGVLAVVPHVFMRTDGGHFTDAPRLPALPHNAGAQIDLGFEPAALRFTVPASADRVELYFKFERWNFTRISGEDNSFTARLDSRASDQFVSNFGNNFVVPVH